MIEPENIKRYQRELRAMCDKAADDPAAFAQVVRLLDDASKRMRVSAAMLIINGYSFTAIGAELGVTRQAARQRFGRAAP